MMLILNRPRALAVLAVSLLIGVFLLLETVIGLLATVAVTIASFLVAWLLLRPWGG